MLSDRKREPVVGWVCCALCLLVIVLLLSAFFGHSVQSEGIASWFEAFGTLLAFLGFMGVSMWEHRRGRERERRDAAPVAALLWHELDQIGIDLEALRWGTHLIKKQLDPIRNVDSIKAYRDRFSATSLERFSEHLGCFDSETGLMLGIVLAITKKLQRKIASARIDEGDGLLARGVARYDLDAIDELAEFLLRQIGEVLPRLEEHDRKVRLHASRFGARLLAMLPRPTAG